MENKTYKNEKNREINEFSLDLLVRIKSGRLKKDDIKEGQEIKNDNILEKLFWNNSSSFNLESYKLKTSFLNKLFSLEKQNSVKTYNNPIVKSAYFNEIDNNKNSFKVFFKGTKEKNYDDQLKFDFIINHLALLEIKAADFFIFKVNLSFRELNKNYSIVDVQHFLNSFNSFNKKTEKYSFEINNKLENSLFDFFRWLLKKSFAVKSPEFVFEKNKDMKNAERLAAFIYLGTSKKDLKGLSEQEIKEIKIDEEIYKEEMNNFNYYQILNLFYSENNRSNDIIKSIDNSFPGINVAISKNNMVYEWFFNNSKHKSSLHSLNLIFFYNYLFKTFLVDYQDNRFVELSSYWNKIQDGWKKLQNQNLLEKNASTYINCINKNLIEYSKLLNTHRNDVFELETFEISDQYNNLNDDFEIMKKESQIDNLLEFFYKRYEHFSNLETKERENLQMQEDKVQLVSEKVELYRKLKRHRNFGFIEIFIYVIVAIITGSSIFQVIQGFELGNNLNLIIILSITFVFIFLAALYRSISYFNERFENNKVMRNLENELWIKYNIDIKEELRKKQRKN